MDTKGGVEMSKKKRRLKKRIKQSRKKNPPSDVTKDIHHLLWTRKTWKGGAVGQLRMHWYCRMPIPRDTLHKEIHHYIGSIPVPRYYSAKCALEQLGYLEKYGGISNEDPIEKRLKVLIALFECIEDCTADALKIQLAIVERFNKPS